MPLIYFKKKTIVEVIASILGYDPYWDNVVLMMHMDGTDLSTSYIDEKGHTLSYAGANLSTTTAKFGPSSLRLTGGNGNTHINTAQLSDFVLGQTFTIESWIKFNNSSAGTILTSGVLTSKLCFSISSDSSAFYFSAGSGGWGWSQHLSFAFARQTNVWKHLAISVNNRQVTLFIDGISLGTQTLTNNLPIDGPYNLSIGGYLGQVTGAYDLDGYMDELRITKGIARYTSNFAVPTTAYPGQMELNYDWFWDKTVLEINGGQILEQTFVDSTNLNNISTFGNTNQGVLSPFAASGTGSIRINGSIGDYVSFPYSNNFTFVGNCTVECWFNADTISTAWQAIFSKATYGQNLDFGIYIAGTNALALYTNYGTVNLTVTVPTITANTWHHLAVVRSSGTTTIYLNGVSYGSLTFGITNANTTAPIVIGRGASNDASAAFAGYISNLRITNSATVYTSNFAVPATPLVAIANTVLLLKGDNNGIIGNGAIIDSSTHNLTITKSGNVAHGSFSPFLTGGSAYFDGNADYLSLPTNNTQTAFQGNNFTIEGWYYFKDGSANNLRPMYYNYSGSFASNCIYFGKHTASSGRVTVYLGNPGPVLALSDPQLPPDNTWVHYAFVRNGNTLSLYRNGVSVSTYNIGSTSLTGPTVPFGFIGNSDSTAFYGFISNMRIINGTAVYTSNFTVPTEPLEAIANTGLLLKFEGAGISDDTRNSVIGTSNTNMISSIIKKNNSSSIAFNGASDYLTISPSTNFNFGSDDFTIESWIYRSTAAQGSFIQRRDNNASYGPFAFYIGTSGNLFCYVSSTGTGWNVLSGTSIIPSGITINSWHHIAIVRKGNYLLAFLNGLLSSSTNIGSASLINSSSIMNIGSDNGGSSNQFAGYMDDFRITKGVARYVSNFTPKSSELSPRLPTGSELIPTDYDPYWQQTTLSMTGSSLTDLKSTVSNSGVSVTDTGPFSISNSLVFSGNSYFTVAPSTNFAFGTNDYTVETFVYLNSLATQVPLFDSRADLSGADAGMAFFIQANGKLGGWGNNAGHGVGTGAATITTGRWYHIAIARKAGITKFFIDGTLDQTVATANYNMTSGNLLVGKHIDSSSLYINGRLSNYRVTKGIARYTSNFTVPTVTNPQNGASF